MKISRSLPLLALFFILFHTGGISLLGTLSIVAPYIILLHSKSNIQSCSHFIFIRCTLILYSMLYVTRILVTVIFPFDRFFGRVNLPESGINDAAILASSFTTLFLLGVLTIHASGSSNCKSARGYSNSDFIWLSTYADVLSALSLISLAFFLLFNGNPVIFIGHLVSHSKSYHDISPISSLGLSFWSIFSVISISIAIHISLIARSFFRILYIFLILFAYIFIFGSRLDLFTIIILVYSLHAAAGLRLSLFTKVSSLILFIPISLLIIFIRLQGNISGIRIYSLITYPILDASQVVISQPPHTFSSIFTLERTSQYLQAFIPRFLSLNKSSIQSSRLDTIFADTLGTELQRGSTGWPTGAFTELYLYGEWLFVGISAYIAGILLARVLAHFDKLHNSSSGRNKIMYLVVLLFWVAWYKDGDFFSSLQGSIRLILYSFIAVKLVDFIQRLKGSLS